MQPTNAEQNLFCSSMYSWTLIFEDTHLPYIAVFEKQQQKVAFK